MIMINVVCLLVYIDCKSLSRERFLCNFETSCLTLYNERDAVHDLQVPNEPHFQSASGNKTLICSIIIYIFLT